MRSHRNKTFKAAVAVTFAAAMVAGSAVSAVAAPSSAFINRTDCNNRSDFFQLWKQPSGEELCFANAGDLPVAVYDVTYLNSGNNAGYVRVDNNGRAFQVNFLKDQRNVAVNGTVTFIHIN
ncbi:MULTISPECIES: beta/gamma crystallin domain-containing protein [unclassified Streptomyces]|uniref:beta/gamma crystallin domain-containing protein n=1 Tax=unclassified Streptomyces TaxID=2593676 RepID=UPI002E2DC13D|nr:beta/gamma crystallin domain-containing protein [Streptomyces sp. NBC_00223]